MAFDILHRNDPAGRYPNSWYAVTADNPLPEMMPLEGAARTEICVIGAGYTGLSAALHLARAGREVTILEAHKVGWGASGRNGGQVSSGQRVDQLSLESIAGPPQALWLWQMGEAAKELVQHLIREYRIDCDLVHGIIHADHRRRFVAESRALVDLLDRKYGYGQIRFLDREEIRAAVASPGYYGGTHDSGAFHLHPLKYAFGLARAALGNGAAIHEASEVLRWSHGTNHVVETAGGTLEAEHVVFACNGYLGMLERDTAARVMPINNFIIATEPLGTGRARSLIPDNSAVADSRFVVNYFRRTADQRLLFGGGEAYSYRFPADIASFVRGRMLGVFPQLRDVAIDHAWGGTLAITRNRLPRFARPERNIWSASGYSGHGVSTATLAGKLIAEAIAGRSDDFDRMRALGAGRFPGGAGLRAPLLALAMHWYALRDRF